MLTTAPHREAREWRTWTARRARRRSSSTDSSCTASIRTTSSTGPTPPATGLRQDPRRGPGVGRDHVCAAHRRHRHETRPAASRRRRSSRDRGHHHGQRFLLFHNEGGSRRSRPRAFRRHQSHRTPAPRQGHDLPGRRLLPSRSEGLRAIQRSDLGRLARPHGRVSLTLIDTPLPAGRTCRFLVLAMTSVAEVSSVAEASSDRSPTTKRR
jgi:hypothetical protein